MILPSASGSYLYVLICGRSDVRCFLEGDAVRGMEVDVVAMLLCAW